MNTQTVSLRVKGHSLLSVHTDGAFGKFHHCAVQLHSDLGDQGLAADDLPPQLDVEVLIVA